jgi:hypothetical protein
MSFARYGEFRFQKGVHHIRIFNNFQKRNYASVIIFIKSLLKLRILFCFNIGVGSFLIRRLTFRHYFSEIQIQQMLEIDGKKDEFQIHDIKKILISVRKFVELSIILFSDNNEEIRLQIKIYVINRFSINILLENNFLKSNDVDILTLLSINGLSVLQMQKYFIILEESRRPIDPLRTSRKRTVIKAIEIFIIIVGIKQNIPVFYKEKHLPKQFEKYNYIMISEKTLYENFIINKFKKLINCLFFKKQNHILFVNFGKVNIRIYREIRITYFEKNSV